jgi:hypothetical protein
MTLTTGQMSPLYLATPQAMRAPPPPNGAGWSAHDSAALTQFYFEDEPARRSAAKLVRTFSSPVVGGRAQSPRFMARRRQNGRSGDTRFSPSRDQRLSATVADDRMGAAKYKRRAQVPAGFGV